MLKVIMVGAIVGIAISILRKVSYTADLYDTAKNFVVKKVADYI